ncbi:MAG: efflux RND transporter permease subunit [Spirochaetales bacterium]|nr:efflux RND transporter permease subunit [Spirochaetales bacterium]
MTVTRLVVNKPTTLVIIFILLIGLGIYSALDLNLDLFPEINPPVLVVFADYEGAGPEEVEKVVTRPLESVISNVSNIENLTSRSSEGSCFLIIEFTWGTNMDEASNDVRDKMEIVKSYFPDEVSTPQIFKFDPSMLPILNLILRGDRSPEELREIAENIVQPRIEQVEGVSMASISGGRQKVIRVEISQNRLEAYNLTLTQVANMLRGQNIQISAGSIEEDNKNYLLRTAGEYHSIEEIKNTVVTYRGGMSMPGMGAVPGSPEVIRLRDVADVFEGYEDESSVVYVDGKPGVYIDVMKQSGANSVKTSDNVIARLDDINSDIPMGIRVEVINDTTKIIRNSLAQVSSTMIVGAILAVLILIFFLRSLKSTLIIFLSIPISFIITLMLMYFFNLTLNIMTLSGLALGIGMLVDNSIVILENIYRYREKGAKLTASAVLGSQEMINAIVASTLTTICVFAPLALFRSQLGMMGELFSGLAFTVVISLSSSLIVAIFLVPVLASKFIPISSRIQNPLTGILKSLDTMFNNFFHSLERLYKNALARVLSHKKSTVLFILVLFVAAIAAGLIFGGFELMPGMEQDFVSVNVELPIGTKLEVTKTLMNQLEQVVRKEIPGYKQVITTIGMGGFFGIFGGSQSNRGRLLITLPPYKVRKETSSEIKNKLRSFFDDFPSAVFSFSGGGQMTALTTPFDILVKTDDLAKAKETAERIRDLLKENIPEVTEPDIDLSEGLPQIEIYINRDKAYSLGLNIASVGQEIRANIDGIIASKYREGGSEYDILVILTPEDRNALPDLEKIFVLNMRGERIPLASFAHLERTTGPVDINRENQKRVIHVTGGLAPGARLNVVQENVENLIDREIPRTEDMVITYSGEFAELMEYLQKFLIIIIISIGLVFGIMASQFESFLDPFIIFFTIPLLLIGVSFLNLATGENFSLFTAVGLVMLVGIVVNNGIVLVDYTNLLRKRGLSITDACIEAGGNRLRPILMTTLTTILALVPMAFFKGEGAELVQPIGKTVIGGLSVSTLLTLFLVPVVYAVFNRMSAARIERRRQKRERKRALRNGEKAGTL